MRSLPYLLVLLALTGCHRNLRNEEAVKQGVMDYLATRQVNVSAMNVSVESLVFRQNEVDAAVVFTPKDTKFNQPMTIHYTLEKKGDRWVVKPRANAGQNPHGGMGANPHGGMGMPEGGAPGGELPPGHPTVPPESSGPK